MLNLKRENLKGYLFIAPSLLFLIIFIAYPIIFSFILSFFEWEGYSNNPFEVFINVGNYIRLIGDQTFWLSLKNTIYFVMTSLIFQNIFGMAFAIYLFYGKLKGSVVWRAIIFFPTMLSAVIVGLVWRRIFMEDGLLNTVLGLFNHSLSNISWLSDPTRPIWVVTFVNIWQWTGYNMVLYYAGLQGINNELIESAKVDGANWFHVITKIVIPHLYKIMSLAIILNIIGGFKVFDIVYVMTKGGPAHRSEVLTSYMYNQSFALFGTNRLGYASTIAIILTIIILIFAIVRIKVDKKTF